MDYVFGAMLSAIKARPRKGWRQNRCIGLYSYPFDPYPEIISYEVPHKIVY